MSEEPTNHVRRDENGMEIDIVRAARMSLASQNHDEMGMRLVICEAQNDEDGDGIARLLSALAGQGAVFATPVVPQRPRRAAARTCRKGHDRLLA